MKEFNSILIQIQDIFEKNNLRYLFVQLLMEYGNPGHPGQNVAKYVVVEPHQEQDHALVNYVEEVLVLGTALI